MRGGGEIAVDVEAAVGDPGEHIDTVSQDEANTAKETGEEERGGEEDKGEHQHDPVVPAAEGKMQVTVVNIFKQVSVFAVKKSCHVVLENQYT